jgi:hypothetical protein
MARRWVRQGEPNLRQMTVSSRLGRVTPWHGRLFALQHKVSIGLAKKDEDIRFPRLPDRFFWYTKF